MQLSCIISFCAIIAIAAPTRVQTHTGESALHGIKKTGAQIACLTCRSKIAVLTTVVLFAAGYIRLTTKSTAKNQTKRSWQATFSKLAGVLNITKLFTNEYWNNFDEIIIGDQFKLIDIEKETTEEDVTVTRHDKEVKAYPAGMFGYFDAYVLRNLKAIFGHIDNITKFNGYLDGICS